MFRKQVLQSLSLKTFIAFFKEKWRTVQYPEKKKRNDAEWFIRLMRCNLQILRVIPDAIRD
jgi:hypothetical protein